MKAIIDEIVTKLGDLPESRLQQVLNFVERLQQANQDTSTVDTSEEPLLFIAGILSGEPLSAQEIEAELYEL